MFDPWGGLASSRWSRYSATTVASEIMATLSRFLARVASTAKKLTFRAHKALSRQKSTGP
jgi:hypothetical protein